MAEPSIEWQRCAAESGVEVWEDDNGSQDARCTRPEGHDGAHAAVVTWNSEAPRG